MIISGAGRAKSAGRCPLVDKGLVSGSSVKEGETIVPAPNYHFNACPHCCVNTPGIWSVGGAGACPNVGAGIISSTGVIIDETVSPSPDDHFAAGPHRRLLEPRSRCVSAANDYPGISTGIVSAARVQRAAQDAAASTPDDHFAAAPDCRVKRATSWRVSDACGSPTIGTRIIFAAGVCVSHAIISAPDDHFGAGPHCSVNVSTRGRVRGAGRCPAICVWIVSSPSIKKGNRRRCRCRTGK